MKANFSYILFSFFTLMTLLSCKSNQSENTQTDSTKTTETNVLTLSDAQLKNAQLAFGNIESGEISSFIKTNGVIDVPPQNMVSVTMPLGGFLKNTNNILPGTYVNKGQVVARMEDEQYIQLQQDYLMTKASLAYTQIDFSRQQELNQSKAVSDKQYQQAMRDYNMDKVKLQSLAAKLRMININPDNLSDKNISNSINVYAPISGYVSKVNANIGSYIAPSSPIFDIINTSDIHLNLKVYDKDLSKLSIGQKVIAYTNENPDKKYHLNIILVSHDLGDGKTAEVHCHFQNYDPVLKPGMYMNAAIESYSTASDVIPEDAVINFEGENYVFVEQSKNKFEMVPVEVGRTMDKNIQLFDTEFLKGKRIVTQNAYTLLMALKNTAEEE